MVERDAYKGVLVKFGGNVRTLREQMRIPKETLANAAEISVQYLRQVERGESAPTVAVVCALARALGRPVVELFSGIDQEIATLEPPFHLKL